MIIHYKELVEIVSELNDEVEDTLYGKGIVYNPFEYRTTGYEQIVTFFGETLWCSENDEREFDEEADEYEPIEDFLRREATEFCKQVGQLQFNKKNTNLVDSLIDISKRNQGRL